MFWPVLGERIVEKATNNQPPQGDEVDGKTWRNTLKHIVNIVSYMMKTSSVFANFSTAVSREVMPPSEKRSALKYKTVRFTEKIFERHRLLVKVISKYQSSDYCSLRTLAEFSQKVSESSKEELQAQEDYLETMLELIGRK